VTRVAQQTFGKKNCGQWHYPQSVAGRPSIAAFCYSSSGHRRAGNKIVRNNLYCVG